MKSAASAAAKKRGPGRLAHLGATGRRAFATVSRPASSLRLTGWAWGGALIGGLVTAVLFAPAAWLTDAVSSATGQQLQLTEPRGTVWQGSAQLVLTGGIGSQDSTALPGRVQWRLRPAFNGLSLALLTDCCTPDALRLAIRPRIGGLRIDLADGRSQWPAQLLAGLGTPWNTLQPEGRLDLSSQSLSAEWQAGRLQLSGGAVLEALGVSSRLSTLRPMGSYRLRLQGGPAIGLTLETIEGSLQLSGSGQWVGSRLRFTGEASATPEREAALSNFLNIIGKRDGLRSVITLG